MKTTTQLILFQLLLINFAYAQKELKPVSGEGRLKMNSLGYTGKTIIDTTYYTAKVVKTIGSFAMEKDSVISQYKFGIWKEYYQNGQLKAQGQYQIDKYINCCYSGLCRNYEHYKTGHWVFYYENGQVKLEGDYKPVKRKITTSCEGGDKVFISLIDKNWSYYNEKGEKIKLNAKTLNLLNSDSMGK